MTDYESERELLMQDAPQTVTDIFERKSVRAFDGRAIPERIRRTILYAASEAPSAGSHPCMARMVCSSSSNTSG